MHSLVCILPNKVPCSSLSVGVPTQGAIAKSLRVRQSRVLMAALALTWSPVTAALVRQLTLVSAAKRHTAPPPTPAVNVMVSVTFLGNE